MQACSNLTHAQTLACPVYTMLYPPLARRLTCTHTHLLHPQRQAHMDWQDTGCTQGPVTWYCAASNGLSGTGVMASTARAMNSHSTRCESALALKLVPLPAPAVVQASCIHQQSNRRCMSMAGRHCASLAAVIAATNPKVMMSCRSCQHSSCIFINCQGAV